MRWSAQYKDEGGRMKDEKMRGVHVLRGNTSAAVGAALAVSQAGCGVQAGEFLNSSFRLHPSSLSFSPSSFLFDTVLM